MNNLHQPPGPNPRQNPDIVETPRSRALVRRASYGEYSSMIALEADDNSEAGGLLEHWRILSRHKLAWLLCGFSGAVAGFFTILPQTPVYQAHTSIEIVGLNGNFMNFGPSSPVAESGPSSETSDIQTQIKILQSESLLEHVAAKLLRSSALAHPLPTRNTAWRRILHLPEPSADELAAVTLAAAAQSLKVRSAGQTRVIEILVDSSDPQLAAEYANTLTSEFIDQNMESRWKTTERTSDWLSHQLDDMRVKLERSEDALQSYARQSGLIFTDEKTNVAMEQLRQLQMELSGAQSERISRQSRFELARTSPPDALADVLNDEALRETQVKITDLRRQIADLGAIYTPEYAKVKRLQAELAALQAVFDRDRMAILQRIRNDYAEAKRKEDLLATAYAIQARNVSGQGERSIQYNILKREADSNRQLYDAMLQQLKQSSIASAMRASNVRVVDPAKRPGRPYKPDLKQSSTVGSLAGIFLGAALIIMRHRADRTIQQPGDSVFYLNVPELGIIPSGKLEVRRRKLAHASAGKDDRVELVSWQRKPSMVAEGFRTTLISILFATECNLRPKILVLSSPGPAEGKSTVVSNLGIAIAEVGQRVLILDADMRRPRLHEIFSLPNTRGLSSLLREKVNLNGDLSLGGLIRETQIPGLSILPSGPGTSSTTNLLYGSYMPQLLTYLRGQYDVVLIDSPPMLQIPDARVVARLADAVVLVIRAGLTTRDAALAACHRFGEDGTHILGTILNDWNPKSSPASYYGNYDKHYRYYPQEPSAQSEKPKARHQAAGGSH